MHPTSFAASSTWPAVPVLLAALLAAAMAMFAVVDAARRANVGRRSSNRRIWLIATIAVAIGHLGGVSLPGGERLHFLGAAWLTLLLGYPRAVLSMSVIVLARLALNAESAGLWGLSLLAEAVLPAWGIWWIAERCRRWLPPKPFIFLIGCALFGVAAINGLQTVFAAGIQSLGSEAPALRIGQYLPFGLLLGWGEALLEAMVTTILVVYLPGVVACFDEEFYLRRRGP